MRARLHIPLMAAALGLLGAGCTLSQSQPPAQVSNFVDPQPQVTWVSGYVWDPEAYVYTFLWCNPKGAPPQCLSPDDKNEAPPVVLPGIPTFEASLASGSMVAVFDPTVQKPAAMTQAPSDREGFWEVGNVESRGTAPFFPLALPGPDGSTALHPGGPPNLPTVPPANYIPTMNLKPIFTTHTQCQNEVAAQFSDKGILESVAKYLTINGGNGPVTVQDLFDPTKFGGVGIVWLWSPAGAGLPTLPAFGTQISATNTANGSPVQVLNIAWSPQQFDPTCNPAAQRCVPPWQSDRGFFVVPGPPGPSPLGLGVIVLPAPKGPPSPIALSFQDSDTTSPGHPYSWQGIPPQIFAPGKLAYVGLPAVNPNPAPTPAWMCLPPPPPPSGK